MEPTAAVDGVGAHGNVHAIWLGYVSGWITVKHTELDVNYEWHHRHKSNRGKRRSISIERSEREKRDLHLILL
jgi:hypothetical protein